MVHGVQPNTSTQAYGQHAGQHAVKGKLHTSAAVQSEIDMWVKGEGLEDLDLPCIASYVQHSAQNCTGRVACIANRQI